MDSVFKQNDRQLEVDSETVNRCDLFTSSSVYIIMVFSARSSFSNKHSVVLC